MNSTVPNVGHLAQALLDAEILKSATGVSTASLTVNLHPLPNSKSQGLIENSLNGL